MQLEDKIITSGQKKKQIEEKIFAYYKEIADDRIKEEFALESKEKHLEEVKKHIAYFKEEVSEQEIFTPRANFSLDAEKKQNYIKEKQQLEEEISTGKENLEEMMKKEADFRNILSWLKSIQLVEEKEDKFETDNDKIMMLEIQEIERQRIARELHDSSTQNLIALINKLELCSNLIDIDVIRCKLELQSTMNYLKTIISDIRSTIYDLRPMSFDDIGMDVTINQFMEKIKNEYNKKIVFIDKDNILKQNNLKTILKLTVFRIIQESCNNALKHAEAENIQVIMKKEDSFLSIAINDDGVGFDVSQLKNIKREDNSGFGLSMMKERVYLLSGSIKIDSEIGKGTSILVKVPFLEEEP